MAIAAAGDGYVKAEALSDAEAIPFEYLQNILRDLRRAGLLRAQRGYEGGYRLSRPAAAISVSDVLEAVASPLTEPYRGRARYGTRSRRRRETCSVRRRSRISSSADGPRWPST